MITLEVFSRVLTLGLSVAFLGMAGCRLTNPADPPVFYKPSVALYGAACPDENIATVVGFGGTIFHTTDGGRIWTSRVSGTTNTLLAVSFSDVRTGIIVGEFGTILRTTDAGSHWALQTSGAADDLQGIAMASAQVATAVG